MILVDKKKKKYWVDFYHYRVVMYALPKTFMFKQHVKMHLASDDPFK